MGERYDTMGLRANDLAGSASTTSGCLPRTCSAIPARVSRRDADLQRPDRPRHRFRQQVKLLDLAIEHVKERRQFGQPLADFELVQDKIGWMVATSWARVDVLPDLQAR